ncbi:MAG: protoporphyrinogen oxidase [Stygiobacter sp. RIFOXYC12_FULL_38_8]|nr:MAG: protoporphyrinogen oxidase [Stygiobacter sp. GWC2_38_9]OGV07284.1 MAG: protoporphyrinogen oxidase [Stygiobacter sp. RIFOXYB2_FULL_37_11]OGV10981.1 MAG: protoporphyrinogen oxidase [Stygiobacter sp. RIFOXYA2_FULL_38_8]OGV15815.1 MAG: protoporphyrinogen oxidase [Stygiobacter sp. RIFOXYC2_FULL_38_25]OGV29218.1 MAG: protoporphyrinogen oxidase [Stygiobacter sp. RIFOXYC12_FULL_38_8]OGV80929.1 MAG: protoporphyrinogen oxidase [Stygiobacter sp. GWF2_38_21]OGV89715.1 MAG: protoporphyrinogen oxid
MNKKKIVILGAGISGLATAFWLNKKGFEVTILEAQSQVGGAMQTKCEDGFLIDFGPNSGLETTPLIRQIVEEVGLSDEMIYASEISSKRYILRNDKLHALPMGLAPFLKTKLFSVKGKLRLFGEPFVGKSAEGYYQSIAQFVERRLGKEFLDYAIDPFVSGVFAGDPTKLSVKSAFPKLYRLEELYGGLIKGMIKGARERKKRAEESKQSAKMFSFTNGMQTFPRAIAKTLEGKIALECRVKSARLASGNARQVEQRADKWQVKYEKNGQESNIDCDQIISTVPAYIAARIFGGLDAELSNHLNEIYYPPVMVLYVGFNKNDVGTPLDGFGFLIPSKEKKKFLGAIWSSTIFPNRSSDDYAAFTLFVGGARSPQLFAEEKDVLIKNALNEFKSLMNIKAEPVILNSKIWQKAIPQYNLGYIEHENYFDKFEKENPGIFLSGNYRGGISVGDCVKNSELVYNKVLQTME